MTRSNGHALPLQVQVVNARRPANGFYGIREVRAQKGVGESWASGHDLFLTWLEALVEWQEWACAAQRKWAEVLKEAQQGAWGRAMEATGGEEDVEEGLPAVTV